jgi:hypothetical protein
MKNDFTPGQIFHVGTDEKIIIMYLGGTSWIIRGEVRHLLALAEIVNDLLGAGKARLIE